LLLSAGAWILAIANGPGKSRQVPVNSTLVLA
jgi:hypothetical protein